MRAGTAESLNNNYVSGVPGAPPSVVAPQVGHVDPIVEPGFSAYWTTQQGRKQQTVYSAPAVIPSAAFGANPWDHVFGPYADYVNAPPAAITPPPAPRVSMA